MGKLFVEYLDGNNIYACYTCKVHLTSYNELVSKAFRGAGGKAYLFNKAINIKAGPKEERMLSTGGHVVCDLFCKSCETVIGWKYDLAYEESQKYKEGKVILERVQIVKQFWTH